MCFCALALALAGALACSEDAPGSAPGEELPAEVSAQVGEKGGTLKAAGMTLEIPAGALDKNVKITVANAGQSAPKELRAEQLSDVYEFGPAGTKFDKDVKVSFEAKADDPKASVYFTKEDGSGFEKIESEKRGTTFTAYVKHFSQGFVGVPLDDEVDAGTGADAGNVEDGGEPDDELDADALPQMDADAEDIDASEPPDAERDAAAPPDEGGMVRADSQASTEGGFDAEVEGEAAVPTAHIVVHSRDRFGALVNQTWAAFQDGQGAWQPLPAPAATGVYEFDVAGVGFGVAFVCSTADFANSWNTLTYAASTTTSLDVVTQGPPCTAGTAPAVHTLAGRLQIGTDQYWRVGHAHQGGSGINFSAAPVDFIVGEMRHNEPNDVVFATGPSNNSHAINRFLVKRGVTLTVDVTGYNLDMVKEGFAPLGNAQAQVLGANDATSVNVFYATRGTELGVWLNTSTTSGSLTRTASFATLPETARGGDDRYLLVGADVTAAQWRIASLAAYPTGNLNVSLPPPFAASFSAQTAPYLRPECSFTTLPDADRYVFSVNWSPERGSNHNFAIEVHPATLGGSSSATLTFPDFSQVSGFDARWVAPTNGSVSAKAAVLRSTSTAAGALKSESGVSATVGAL